MNYTVVKKCLSSKQMGRCGIFEGFEENDNGLLILQGNQEKGCFISRIYDSGERQTRWNRMILDIGDNALIRVYVWLFDNRSEGEKVEKLTNMERQLSYIKSRAQFVSNYREMLLYGKDEDAGRFAMFAVEVIPKNEHKEPKMVSFTGYEMSFPKESFAAYLPSIYQNNPKLDRFLAVFQNIYLQLERDIDNIANELDYDYCSDNRLIKLAGWMGWGEIAGHTDKAALRTLLREGIYLNSRKGTCEYYKRIVKILLGQESVMIEDKENGKAALLIEGKPNHNWNKYNNWLKRNVPIGRDVSFVFLENTFRINDRFFLDRNACLSLYETELGEDGTDIDTIRLL